MSLRNLFIILFLFFTTAVSAKTFSTQQPAHIYMVLWRGCEEACQGFKQQLESQQLPVSITIRDAGRDKSKLKGFLEEAKQLKPDLVVTWGTSVSKAIIGTLDNQTPSLGSIPALFMIVADPVGAGIIESYENSGRATVTGVRNRVPEEVQIRAIKDYIGEDQPHIGIIYSESELNSLLNTQKLEQLSAPLGFQLTPLKYRLDTQGVPLANQLPQLMQQLAANNVDMVYVGSSSYNRANRKVFIAEAAKAGLPVASAYEVMVTQADGLIAVANRYYNVGKLAAKQARKVLFEGAKPGELNIPSLSRYSIFINMDSARKFKRYPPIQLLRLAELVNP